MDAKYPLLFVQNLFQSSDPKYNYLLLVYLILLLNAPKCLSPFVQIIPYLMHSKHASLLCNTPKALQHNNLYCKRSQR